MLKLDRKRRTRRRLELNEETLRLIDELARIHCTMKEAAAVLGEELRECVVVVLSPAFERVETVRGETPLTYFEFGTLAAWVAFSVSPFDLWPGGDGYFQPGGHIYRLLVGIGGRWD